MQTVGQWLACQKLNRAQEYSDVVLDLVYMYPHTPPDLQISELPYMNLQFTSEKHLTFLTSQKIVDLLFMHAHLSPIDHNPPKPLGNK